MPTDFSNEFTPEQRNAWGIPTPRSVLDQLGDAQASSNAYAASISDALKFGNGMLRVSYVPLHVRFGWTWQEAKQRVRDAWSVLRHGYVRND